PPRTGKDVVRRLSCTEEIHRDERELKRCAPLNEKDLVLVRKVQQLLDIRLGGFMHLREDLAAMADLHDGCARTREGNEIALHFLQYGQGECRGTGRKIMNTGSSSLSHGGSPRLEAGTRAERRMNDSPSRIACSAFA